MLNGTDTSSGGGFIAALNSIGNTATGVLSALRKPAPAAAPPAAQTGANKNYLTLGVLAVVGVIVLVFALRR